MTAKDLMLVLETIEGLSSLRDINVCFDDGRDGESSLVPVKAIIKNTGVQYDPQLTIIFRREN